MKTAYRFLWDVRRMGVVEGVFIADSSEVDACLGKRVYFGEILGKHSEIYGTLGKEDLAVLTQDPGEIELIERLKLTSGYNPLDYIEETES